MDNTPELVTSELPAEVEKMEAALRRGREEMAAQASAAAAVQDDLFVDARPVSGAQDIREVDLEIDLENVGPVNLPYNDMMDQIPQLYDVDVTHTRDRHGRHYWNFDDRRRMPLLVVAFRTKQKNWLCCVNDVIISLPAFLSIVSAQSVAGPRREFGAPPGMPPAEQLQCRASTGDIIAIPHATIPQLMAALQNIPADPENDGVPVAPTA